VTVIENAANLGFARANNIGIRASSGELILLLNSDTVVPAGAIDHLVDRLHHDSAIAVIGPRLVDSQGRAELSFGSMIGPLSELRQKILVRGHARRLPVVSDIVETLAMRPRFPDWVSGACLLVRRSDAEAVHLLDERYFMYAEDVDFCAAIRARGRRICFDPAVTVVHRRGRSAATSKTATDAAYRRSQLAFYEKHHPGWTPVLRWYLRLRGIAT
jgi:GT2 family glycosyltransferase